MDNENVLLKDCSVKDVIEHFGEEAILKEIENESIVDYIENNKYILNGIDDQLLIDGVTFVDSFLDELDNSEIIDYLIDKGYNVSYEDSYDSEEILKILTKVCRQIKPSGYIDKEEAKQIICDYIDNNMVKSMRSNVI